MDVCEFCIGDINQDTPEDAAVFFAKNPPPPPPPLSPPNRKVCLRGRVEQVDFVKESKLLLDYISKIERGEQVMGPNPVAPSPAGEALSS